MQHSEDTDPVSDRSMADGDFGFVRVDAAPSPEDAPNGKIHCDVCGTNILRARWQHHTGICRPAPAPTPPAGPAGSKSVMATREAAECQGR